MSTMMSMVFILKAKIMCWWAKKTKFYIINATDASSMTTLGSALIGNRTRDIVSVGSLAF